MLVKRWICGSRSAALRRLSRWRFLIGSTRTMWLLSGWAGRRSAKVVLSSKLEKPGSDSGRKGRGLTSVFGVIRLRARRVSEGVDGRTLVGLGCLLGAQASIRLGGLLDCAGA